MLPLDDCLYALQPAIPHLTRSSLHRCLRRHGISRLPQVEGEASAKRKFKAYPIGYFHIDIAEVRTAQGKLYLLVAIDRTSKFAFVEMHEKVARRTAGDFLRRLIAAVPYKVHTVLTDNGTHFTTPGNTSSAAPDIKAALEAGELVWAHAFEYACAQNDIDHRLTKPKHPWTNGQVERMNRTIKDATVKRYFYETHDQLRAHLRDFVDAYNFARRLKTLRGLTPYEFVCKAWTSEPQDFKISPLQQMPGLNIYIGIAQNMKNALGVYSPGDREQTGIDEEQAVRGLTEKYEVVRAMFRPETPGGFDYRPALAPGATPQSRLSIMAGAIDWVLTLQQDAAAKETSEEGKKRAHRRYADAVAALSRAFALAGASDQARAIRDEGRVLPGDPGRACQERPRRRQAFRRRPRTGDPADRQPGRSLDRDR